MSVNVVCTKLRHPFLTKSEEKNNSSQIYSETDKALLRRIRNACLKNM